MGKKKKKFKKKVNPEKSNKMIIAVAIGVVIVIAAFLILTILGAGGSKAPKDKNAFMNKELKYLKTTEGISQLKLYPDQNKIVIIYESYKEDKQDFAKIAWYAGLKVSNKMRDEEVTVVLAKDKEEQVVRSFTIKNGESVVK